MKKNILKKLGGLFLGLTMGLGIAVGVSSASKVSEVKADNASFKLSSEASVTVNGVTASFAQGSGTSAPKWYDAGLRLYTNNTFTLSSDNAMTSVSINWEKQGSKAFASATASVGSYTHPSAAGTGTWTGSAKEIVFTVSGSGQLQLNTFSVKYESANPIESISVSGQKTAFNQGDAFSFGGTVTGTFTDKTTKDVTSDCTFSGYDLNVTGAQTVTVTYKDTDVETTYPINVNADTLESITLGGSVTGKKNSAWDLSGVTATGHYSVGGDKVLSGFTPVTTTATPTEPGDYTVHVSITVGGVTGTKDYSVNISNAHTGESEGDAFTVAEAMEHMFANNSSVTSLFYVRGILTANPDNTTYGNFYISDDGTSTTTIRVYGATATSSALKESSGKWTFTNPKDWSSNETTKNIVAGYEVVMHARLYMFNTTYEADGVVVSSSLPALNSIAVTTAPTKTEYEAGESFNPEGMVVKGCYGVDGKIEKEISGYTVSPNGALAAGTTFVTISYTDGGVTKSTTQAITVSAPITDWEFKSIVFSVGTGKTTYNIGDSFNKAGFSVIYTEHSEIAGKDRQTEVIDSSTINNFDSSAEKTCYVTATYAGHTSNSVEVSIVDTKSYPQLMDASKIVEGMVIRIGSAAKKAVAGAFDTKYLSSVEATFDDGLTSLEAGVDFTIGKSGDYYTLTSSEGSLKAKGADLSYTEGTDTWTISIDDSGAATIASSANASNRILYNSGSPRFKTYTSSVTSSNLLPEIYVVSVPKDPTAEEFATKFINDTNSICANPGNNKTALEAIWDDVEAEYTILDATEKAILKNAESKVNGTVIEQAMARYDFVCAKYELSNFIARTLPLGARVYITTSTRSNDSAITAIIAISLVSITALGVLIVIKKRKTIAK